MPKRFASMDIWILNRPSVSTLMPSTMQKKLIAPSGWSSTRTPREISRMPKARSYWNARRNRSLEKYAASFTMPNTIIAMPSTIPTTVTLSSGTAIITTPNTQSSAEIIIYDIFAAFIGLTERI